MEFSCWHRARGYSQIDAYNSNLWSYNCNLWENYTREASSFFQKKYTCYLFDGLIEKWREKNGFIWNTKCEIDINKRN